MIHRFSVRSTTDSEPDAERQGGRFELPDLELELDYYVEFDDVLSSADTALISSVLEGQIGTKVTVDEPFPSGTVTLLHRRGVVDNENTTIVSMCELLGLRARAGKIGRCYRSSSPKLADVIETAVFNSATEEIH